MKSRVESMIKTIKYFVLWISLYCIHVHIVHYTKKALVLEACQMHLKLYINLYTKALPCAISVRALISIYCPVLEWPLYI